MFVCIGCHEANYSGWHMSESYGACELCNKSRTCYDCRCHHSKGKDVIIDYSEERRKFNALWENDDAMADYAIVQYQRAIDACRDMSTYKALVIAAQKERDDPPVLIFCEKCGTQHTPKRHVGEDDADS